MIDNEGIECSEVLRFITARSAALAAACRRLELNPDMVLKALRVACGVEAMPLPLTCGPWEAGEE